MTRHFFFVDSLFVKRSLIDFSFRKDFVQIFSLKVQVFE